VTPILLYSTNPRTYPATSGNRQFSFCHLGSIHPGTELPAASYKVSSRSRLKIPLAVSNCFVLCTAQGALAQELFSCHFPCSKAGPREGRSQRVRAQGRDILSSPVVTYQIDLQV